jgi:hypothetical protein
MSARCWFPGRQKLKQSAGTAPPNARQMLDENMSTLISPSGFPAWVGAGRPDPIVRLAARATTPTSDSRTARFNIL